MNTSKSVQLDTISVGEISGINSIEIRGALDYLDPQIDTLVQQFIDDGQKCIVFDLHETIYLTALGVASIIKALKKIRAINGTLFIYGATEDMAELLKIGGLAKYIIFMS